MHVEHTTKIRYTYINLKLYKIYELNISNSTVKSFMSTIIYMINFEIQSHFLHTQFTCISILCHKFNYSYLPCWLLVVALLFLVTVIKLSEENLDSFSFLESVVLFGIVVYIIKKSF